MAQATTWVHVKNSIAFIADNEVVFIRLLCGEWLGKPLLQFDRFSAFSLEADGSQRYRHNRASRTLLRPVDWLFLSYHPVQCKNTVPRQLSDRYSAPEPPTTAAPPQNESSESAESADEVDCIVLQPLLWMAAVHRWMRRWMVRRGRLARSRYLWTKDSYYDKEQIPSDTTTSFSSVLCTLFI